MKTNHRIKTTPATDKELAAAMKALGAYDGDNTDAEHSEQVKIMGKGSDYYRMRLVNALLGIVETEAMLSEGASPSTELMLHAHQQALDSAGAMDSKEKLIEFLRWRTLRIAGPLRLISQDKETGPIPVAASWAAEALQQMLKISADGQHIDPATMSPEAIKADIKKAKEALKLALANLDIMLDLMKQIEDMLYQSKSQGSKQDNTPQKQSNRVERSSKLLLLDMYVPLCVERRTIDFFLSPVDWPKFQQKAQEWGIWRMSEQEFTKFEKKKMQEFTKTLETVSPKFSFKVFAMIENLMGTVAKATNSNANTEASQLPRISELLASVGQDREKLFDLARQIEPDLVRRFKEKPARNTLEALLMLVDELFKRVQATTYPVPDDVRVELARFFAEYFTFSGIWPYTRSQMQAAMTMSHPDFRPDISDEYILVAAREVEKMLIEKLKEEPSVMFRDASQAGMSVVYLVVDTLFGKSPVRGGDMHETHHVASVLVRSYEFTPAYPYSTQQIREALKTHFRIEP